MPEGRLLYHSETCQNIIIMFELRQKIKSIIVPQKVDVRKNIFAIAHLFDQSVSVRLRKCIELKPFLFKWH